jgi:hypothetical protein
MVKHQRQGLLTDEGERDVDARQRWDLGHRVRLIVKTNDGHIVRDMPAFVADGMHGAHGTIIVARDQGREFGADIDHMFCGCVTTGERVSAVCDQRRIGFQVVPGQRSIKRLEAGQAVAFIRWVAGNKSNMAMPMLHQVCHCLMDASRIVR